MDNTKDNIRLGAKIVGVVTAKLLGFQEKKAGLNLTFIVKANVLQNEYFDSFFIRADWDKRGTRKKRLFLCMTPKIEFLKTKNSANEMRNCLRESFSLYQEFRKILETPVENLRDVLDGVDQKNDHSLILYWIYDSRPKYVQTSKSHSPILGTFRLRKFQASKENELLQDVKSENDESLFNEFVSNLVLEDARIESEELHKLLKNALQKHLASQKKWSSCGTIMKKYLGYVDKELFKSGNFLRSDSFKLQEIVRNYLNDQHQTARCNTSVVKDYVNSLKNHSLSYIIVPETPPTRKCSRIKQAFKNHSDEFFILTAQNLKEWRHIILKNICQNKELCTELILSIISIDNEVKDFLKCIRGTCGVRVVSPTWKEEIHEFLQSLGLTYSSWTEKWSNSDRDRLPAFPLRRLAGSSSTHGVLFEAKMAALVALRARRRGLTFQLHANVAAVRPWDDLVLFVDGPGAPVTYLVQLKHGEKGGLVPLQAFKGSRQKDVAEKDEGNFSLIKYFKKFKELTEKYKDRDKLEDDDDWLLCNRNLDDFRFIIYTNKKVEKPSSMPQAGGSTDFLFEGIFETGDGTNTFSFQAGDEVGQMRSDALFQQQFLPRMRVLGAQAHVDRLHALLAEEVRRELCPRVRPAVADECAHLYVQAFKRWLEGPGERVVSQASGELEAAVGEALRRRARAGAGGGALAFQDEHCARVRRALAQAGCVRVRVCVAGVRRGHRAAKVLQLLDADFPERWMYVDDQAASDLRVDDLLAASARCQVVVLDVKRVTPQVKDFVSKVAVDPGLKLVVLSSHSGRVRDFPGVKWQEISEEWTLEHLIPEAQNKMMDLEVSFQGALMPLRELQAQGAWPEEQLRGGVDGPLLSALIGCDAALGEAPPVDAGAPSHVPRTLHHASVLRREVLGLRNSASDHLVLSGFSAEELRQEEQWQKKQRQEKQGQELRPENLASNERLNLITNRWTILDENEPSEDRVYLQFNEVCTRLPGRNVHLIQNTNGKLLWGATIGNPEAVSKFVVPWSETCREPYAPRCIHERSALETAVKCQQRIPLLLGEPGIGKTSFLCSLAEMQREEEPHKWAVVLKLLDHVDILEDLPNENELGERDVVRLLAAAAGVAAPASSAARRCLEAALFHSGAVHVFVDGVDEVLPAYREKTLRLLEFLVWKTKAERVWVATRPEVNVTLRRLLPSALTMLMPLSREEQLKYLRSKWSFDKQREDVFEEVANKLLDAYAFTPGRGNYSLLHNQMVDHSLLGVPLYLDLVIEAYTDDVKHSIENNDIFTLTTVSQLQLFEKFIQKQRERYKERYGLSGGRSKLSNSSKDADDTFHRLHQNFAMVIWTSSTSPNHQNAFKESVKKFEDRLDLEKSGILRKLEDGRIQFVHFTFVEYFVATWLFDKVKEDKNHPSWANTDFKLEQLLETVYKNPWSRVMVFLDLMLAEEQPLHKAIIENDTKNLPTLISQRPALNKDQGGRTALHVAAAYGRSDCVNHLLESGSYSNEISQCDSLLQWTPLKYASVTKNLPIAEILLKKGANRKDLVEPVDITQILTLDLVQVLQALMSRGNGLSRLVDSYRLFTASADSSMVKVPHLTVAANAGSKNVVDLLIKEGADVESKDEFGESPLHKAALEGHKDIADILISAGANIHCRGKNEFTPLHIASGEGHEEVVRLLLSKGANVFKKTSTGTMPVHVAAQNGHKVVAEMLINAPTSNAALHVNSLDTNNSTPLHYAAEFGHKDAVETLIKNGAKIFAKSKDGHMPIHLSALHGHKEVIQVLLRYGADIHSREQFGYTPLHIASYKGHVEVVRLLLSKGADVFKKAASNMMPIHLAAEKGHKTVVEELLQAPISNAALQVSQPADLNITPLHLAADKGHKEVVEILIENGANVSGKTEDGDMAIHLSAFRGHKEVTEILLQNGADINSRGENDCTPLHCACENGHDDVVKMLLEAGAEVESCDAFDHTPLLSASEMGHVNVVKTLLSRGADVNSTSIDGDTPLHFASRYGHSLLVVILLSKGAHVNARERGRHQTALHLAAQQGHKEVVQLLLSRGADAHLKDQKGRVPLQLALSRGHSDVVELLLRDRSWRANLKMLRF